MLTKKSAIKIVNMIDKEIHGDKKDRDFIQGWSDIYKNKLANKIIKESSNDQE